MAIVLKDRLEEPIDGHAQQISASARAIGVWLAIAAYLLLVASFAWNSTPLAQGLAAIGIAARFTHASFAYGLKHALLLFLMCTAITFSMENLGATTGFSFGHYHFEVAHSLPHIGTIPVVVGPSWFGMGYFLLDGCGYSARPR